MDGWRVSILQPIVKEAEAAPDPKDCCAKCGKTSIGSAQFAVCAKCKVARYCSRECQAADWPSHKKTCVKPDKQLSADIIDVDMSVDVMAARGMQGYVTTTWSHDASSSSIPRGASRGPRPAETPQEKMFVVKIQVLMSMPGMSSNPVDMMCYNQKRDVQLSITTDNCSEANRLDGIVRSGSIAGGMKGYFNAYVSEGKLRIMAHEPLALHPW